MRHKRKIYIKSWVIGLYVSVSFMVSLGAAIPPEERAALIAFYYATNGDQWQNNSGWKKEPLHFDEFAAIGTEDKWYGVTVTNGHVTKLQYISNRLEGYLPEEMENLKYLEELILYEKGIGDNIPSQIGLMEKLNNLKLDGNYEGSLPTELGNLVNLESLQLIGQFSGSLPIQIGNLKQLTGLMLNGNFTGELPESLGDLVKLQSLELFGNFSGNIPAQLGNLTQLKRLLLTYPLNSAQFKRLTKGNFTPAEPDDSDSINLTGPIPVELSQLTQLEDLTLLGQLNGSIPPELGNLKKLKRLRLQGNQLTGPIPSELSEIPDLRDLNLADNLLSGSIPEELGNLKSLRQLWLNHNKLTGSVPDDIGNLTHLFRLKLNGNALTGQIPDSIEKLSIKYIDLSYNALTNADLYEWAGYQTVVPTGVSVIPLTETTADVVWEIIKYTSDSGGYYVYMRESESEPWMLIGTVPTKAKGRYNVTDLSSKRTYYFVIQTFTHAHAGNPNELVSQYSKEVEYTSPFN
jgi:Leucine-rich repeat (LRR) protein